MIFTRQTIFYKILLLLLFNSSCYASTVALSAMRCDFILETKRIQISEYPYVFNPSIVRWQDSFLMSFRIHDGKNSP